MSNYKKDNKRDKRVVKPLTDLELIRLGIRNEHVVIDKSVFVKTDAEKSKLKMLKSIEKSKNN
jgi:hypothetical protein